MTHRLVGTLAAVGLSLAGIVAAAPSAHAATCYADGCHHKSPTTTGCNGDAITARSKSAPDGTIVELRYSATCRAAWGRVRNSRVGAEAFVENTQGRYDSQFVSTGRDVFTLMVNDRGVQARACYAPNGGSDFTACTGWY
ncbi:DUF2690 domain-containing protein [Streptomyces sp. NPDC002566]|uniref:DUF2690 domain-containing protein n=1 Tax=Streptomyces sp. NPDC002566 TaxID=3364650 RepID=UPI00369FFBD9